VNEYFNSSGMKRDTGGTFFLMHLHVEEEGNRSSRSRALRQHISWDHPSRTPIFSQLRPHLHRFCLVCTGLVWFAPVWFGLHRFGLHRFGLHRFGLHRFGPCVFSPTTPARPASVLRDFLYARRPVGRLSYSSLKCTPQRHSLLRRPTRTKQAHARRVSLV
jgi:hypothetical protein